MSDTESTYTDAQANEILRTAVRLAAPSEITFEELVLAAAELGISREEIDEAKEVYWRNSSEEGQRAEFRRMQRRQLGATALHAGVIALIILLIVIFDFPEYLPIVSALLAIAAACYLGWQYNQLRHFESEENQAAFRDWQRKKNVWLRPEKAKLLVDKVLSEPVSPSEKYEMGSPERKLEHRLRQKLGYDRKRARAVLQAYIREHPEFEARLDR